MTIYNNNKTALNHISWLGSLKIVTSWSDGVWYCIAIKHPASKTEHMKLMLKLILSVQSKDYNHVDRLDRDMRAGIQYFIGKIALYHCMAQVLTGRVFPWEKGNHWSDGVWGNRAVKHPAWDNAASLQSLFCFVAAAAGVPCQDADEIRSTSPRSLGLFEKNVGEGLLG